MKLLLSPDEARHIVLSHSAPLNPISKNHADVLGLTLAQDVVARDDLPPFDNSSMDGYALRADDTRAASTTNPLSLEVLGTVAAGSAIEYSITSGKCVKIMTGAPVPATADAVVMREETVEDGVAAKGIVQILEEAQRGQNIRRRGSDVRSGETVIPRGTLIGAAQWGMLASLGYAQVEVFPRPRLGIITTGDEIVGTEDVLSAGQIRDSNSWTLRALAQECGAIVVEHCKVGDDAQILREKLLAMFQLCDIVVTSGGVSAGDFDVVRDVLPEVADVHFWKIAMKPGKPVMFATRDENQRTLPVFGLPGNPVSVMVAWEQFVRPCVLKLQGRTNFERLQLAVRVLDSFRSSPDRVEFARAWVERDTNGDWTARMQGEQGSGRLSTMTNANALLVVPAEIMQVQAGDILQAQIITN